MKVCSKCGESDFYKSGQCATCQRARMRARKAGEPFSTEPGRPPRKIEVEAPSQKPAPVAVSGGDFHAEMLDQLKTPRKRLEFIIQRFAETTAGFQRERDALDKFAEQAYSTGNAADIKFAIKQGQELLARRAAYEMKMGEHMEAFQEFAAADDDNTPIEFVLQPVIAPEGLVRLSVGDKVSFDDLLNKPDEQFGT